MIDSAVIDLMHHMNKGPLALERRADDPAWGAPDTGQREVYVREIEREVRYWIAETERRVASLAKDITAHPEIGNHRRLDQMIEVFEAAVPSEVAFYRRTAKRSFVTVKRARAALSKSAPAVAEERKRTLAALAAYGLARQDVVFALRALRNGLTEAGRAGPVFDNPDDLEAYLLSAVA